MKQIFDRLRRWLIKKLGGYTERFTPMQRQIEHTKYIQPQRVQAQISISPPGPASEFSFKEYCESSLLNQLVRELYQSDFIMWESENEKYAGKVTVRATLYVVAADDLKLGGVEYGY